MTWSISERTVDVYGFTRVAEVVAPPEAKLYVRREGVGILER